MSYYMLADCNNFYVSCERAFDPRLQNKPVLVLSNNDGCVIARSNETKALGIGMGEPFFKVADICHKNNVAIKSTNLALYGDMSQRVMNTLKTFANQFEIYSVDEAFLSLDDNINRPGKIASQIRSQVLKHTGIPVSVGIAQSKTLCKAANYFAKKFTSQGYYSLLDHNIIQAAMHKLPIDQIWGIGRAWSKKLCESGIKSAYQLIHLAQNNPQTFNQKFNINIQRTLLELQGIPCIETAPRERRKQIMVSRSFGKKVTEHRELIEALSCHTARAFEKLRQQKSLAKRIQVFVLCNQFGDHQYKQAMLHNFTTPTNNTSTAITAARNCLAELFNPGTPYKKIGVILSDLIDEDYYTPDMFASLDEDIRQNQAMQTIDLINNQMGSGSLFFASQGTNRNWVMRSTSRSPCYTTRWTDLPVVN